MSTTTPTEPALEATQQSKASSWLRNLVSNQQFILLIVLALLITFFAERNSLFFRTQEFGNLISDFCGLALLAVAETYVISSGGIDLSVGSTVAFSGICGAYTVQYFMEHHMNQTGVLLLGTLACALTGGFVGSVNAFLITKVKLVPFVATLVTLSSGAGLALVFAKGGQEVGLDPGAVTFSAEGLGMFAWISIIVIVITLVLGLVLHNTRYGRYNFAIGSNDFAARAAGINVKRHVASVYVLSGVLAGLTGMFFYIKGGGGAATTGIGEELNAIAAVVIGGASLQGGVGRMSGTVLGAMILTVVVDGLIFINVAPTWNQVVVAAFIALAATLQTIRPQSRS